MQVEITQYNEMVNMLKIKFIFIAFFDNINLMTFFINSFDHFCDVIETILQRLSFPTNVLQFLINVSNPREIFERKDLLLQLSQLKKISLEISYW